MPLGDDNQRVRAWARVASAAAQAHTHPRAEANRELFDALEFAATEARLDLRDLVDAYAAGARDLDDNEVWTDVEDYLERIAGVHASRVADTLARTKPPLPDWRRRLEFAIAAREIAVAAHRAFGGQDDRLELLRGVVVDVLNRAGAGGVTEDELDAFIRTRCRERCDLVSVITSTAWIAAERVRLAERRGMTLPGLSWATVDEIARDRGVALDVVSPLVDDALQRDLLTARPGRGVAVTPVGLSYLEETTHP